MADATGPIATTTELQNPYDFLTEYAVKDEEQIWQGIGLAVDSDGYLVPSSDADALYTVGRAEQSVLGDGVKTCRARNGIFLFKNGVNALTIANRLGPCYWEDDQTVGSSSGTGILAGLVVDVSSAGVFVAIGFIAPANVEAGGLVGVNNLDDVENPNTARFNIGADKRYITMRASNLIGADATRYLTQSPVAGTITKIYSTLCGAALATGNATLTGKIAGTGITNGVVTIAESGSAIGDKDSATPSALNVIAAGDLIEFLVGGTNDDADAFAELLIEITLEAA